MLLNKVAKIFFIKNILILYDTIIIKNNFLFKNLKNVIYSCDGQAEFSESLLNSSVSHDILEIIIICRFAANLFLFFCYQC